MTVQRASGGRTLLISKQSKEQHEHRQDLLIKNSKHRRGTSHFHRFILPPNRNWQINE